MRLYNKSDETLLLLLWSYSFFYKSMEAHEPKKPTGLQLHIYKNSGLNKLLQVLEQSDMFSAANPTPIVIVL